MRFIEKSNNKETIKVSFRDALWRDERYSRASIVNIILMSFHVLTGYSAVKGFSNSILTETYEAAGETGMTPRQGTYLVGAVNLFGAAAGLWICKTFGRRTILLWGHFILFLCQVGCAFSAFYAYSTLELVFILIFVFTYMASAGPANYIYLAETCTDTALAVVIFTNNFWALFENMTTE
jgi:hypothetical protein